MTQDTDHTDRDGPLNQHHVTDQDNTEEEEEEAFPPSYEEAISHIDDNPVTSPTLPRNQPNLSPPLQSHQRQPSRNFDLNSEIQNDSSRQGDHHDITFGDSSAPLKPSHAPSAPPAAIPAANNSDSQGSSSTSAAAPQLNPFGHSPIDHPFRQQQHHQHHHQHPFRHQGQHSSPFNPSISDIPTPPRSAEFPHPSSTIPGFGPGAVMFGGPPPGPFPFGPLPPSSLPPGGFLGHIRPLPPPGMFGGPIGSIPGRESSGPLPADFRGFPPPMPPGSIGGMGSFSFGGPVQDTRAGSGSGSGFSFGQTEAAPGTAAHVPPASPAPSAPTAPPAPPALPGPPARPAMPVMPSTQLSSPDIPKVPELPAIPKISAPFMVPSPPASIPSDTLPIVVPDAASRPSSFFMAATSDSRPVPPSGIQPSESSLTAHDITTATYKRTERGIESEDYVLNDPFQLYRFFVAHNDKPQMHVLITGSHVEKKSVEKRNGDGSVSNVHNRVKVRDFKIDLDLTSYISPYGTIKTLPDPKTSTKLSLREVIEQHVSEENPFKEMHMKKKVSWDYEDLTRAIVHAIRSVNYRYKIEISYPTSNNRVIVHSAAPLAQFMRSTWTKTFCGLSLVDIVFYPLREYYKIVKDKNIQSEFHMTISTADFMRNSYWKIVDQVQFKNE